MQLFFLVFWALVYVMAEQWIGKSIVALIIAFCTAILLAFLVMEGWATPILCDICESDLRCDRRGGM